MTVNLAALLLRDEKIDASSKKSQNAVMCVYFQRPCALVFTADVFVTMQITSLTRITSGTYAAISKYRDSCKVYRDTYRVKSIAIHDINASMNRAETTNKIGYFTY